MFCIQRKSYVQNPVEVFRCKSDIIRLHMNNFSILNAFSSCSRPYFCAAMPTAVQTFLCYSQRHINDSLLADSLKSKQFATIELFVNSKCSVGTLERSWKCRAAKLQFAEFQNEEIITKRNMVRGRHCFIPFHCQILFVRIVKNHAVNIARMSVALTMPIFGFLICVRREASCLADNNSLEFSPLNERNFEESINNRMMLSQVENHFFVLEKIIG